MAGRYIPALSYGWLTRWYDPVVRWTTRDRVFRASLVQQADLRPGQRVLDAGCGSGTLALAMKRAQPRASVTGLDGDPAILKLARQKAAGAGAEITWVEGRVDALPFPDAAFDRVVSSLVFHHLDRPTKLAALREIRRVLAPGGEFHLADWGRAANFLMRAAFLPVQLLDGFVTTRDNIRGDLPRLMREAGFDTVTDTGHFNTPCGTLSLFRASNRQDL